MPFFCAMIGIPGSGKSSIAASIKTSDGENTTIISADDYFKMLGGGKYKFHRESLKYAHQMCKNLCESARDMGMNIVLDNTNLQPNVLKEYFMMLPNEYTLKVCIVSRDVEEAFKMQRHGVDEATHKRMAEQFADIYKRFPPNANLTNVSVFGMLGVPLEHLGARTEHNAKEYASWTRKVEVVHVQVSKRYQCPA